MSLIVPRVARAHRNVPYLRRPWRGCSAQAGSPNGDRALHRRVDGANKLVLTRCCEGLAERAANRDATRVPALVHRGDGVDCLVLVGPGDGCSRADRELRRQKRGLLNWNSTGRCQSWRSGRYAAAGLVVMQAGAKHPVAGAAGIRMGDGAWRGVARGGPVRFIGSEGNVLPFSAAVHLVGSS